MTGLRPAKDKITEVAVIITDFDLNELATYEASVKHPEAVLRKLTSESVWHTTQPEYTENIIQDSLKGKPEDIVQQELVQLVQKHIGLSKKPADYPHFPGSLEAKGEVFLAGNSISTDQAFIDLQWPDFARILHYRTLDVSSFKLWLLGSKHLPKFEKRMSHRALDDIRESIAEMKYYTENM
jgi:oligoribonuclease